jgi:3-deoxy-D-manno-octulosonate 8-phosphate phosphatase KdsC-like HAD superfamily phosphatase
MQITKTMVEARKAQMIAERDKHLAIASAYNGSAEDCDHWLEILDSK